MSKRYTLSGADAATHVPEHPERTGYRNATRGVLDFDRVFQVWTNRAALARTIRMQEKRAPETCDWRACVPLRTTEGY